MVGITQALKLANRKTTERIETYIPEVAEDLSSKYNSQSKQTSTTPVVDKTSAFGEKNHKGGDKDQQKLLRLIQTQESLEQLKQDCEIIVSEKLQQIEDLFGARSELVSNINQLTLSASKKKMGQLQIQSLKNNERMMQEIVKRIESHLVTIAAIIDEKAQEAQ